MADEKDIMSREEMQEFVAQRLFAPFAAQLENIVRRARPQDQIDTRALEIAQAALTKSESVAEQINEHLRGHDQFYKDMRDSLRRIHERLESRDGVAFKLVLAALIGCLGIIGWFVAPVLLRGGA